MNVFTTDHPLSSDSPHRHGWIASVSVIAVLLCPFLLGLFWYSNVTGNQDTTDYTPDPFWEVLVGAAVYSLAVPLVALGLYRSTAWLLCKIGH